MPVKIKDHTTGSDESPPVFSVTGQLGHSRLCGPRGLCSAATHLCHHSAKATTDSTQMSEHGCATVRLYLFTYDNS